MEKITTDLFRQYRIPQSVKVSPDGKKTAVTLQTANNEEDSYNYHIYLKEEGDFRRMTGLGKESSFIFDDNETLLFPSLRDSADRKKAEEEELTVYYRLSLKGGEAQKAFTVPFHAKNIDKLSEGMYLITADTDATVPDYYKMTAEEKKAVAEERKKNKDFTVIDEHPFWFNGLPGFRNKMRNRLFLYEENTNTVTAVSAPLFQTGSYAVIDHFIYYCGCEYAQTSVYEQDILAFDVNTKEVRTVFKNSHFNNGHQAVAAYNGKLIFLAATDEVWGSTKHPDFYEVNPETGEMTLITEADYSLNTVINRNDHILFNTMDRYSNTVCRMDETGIHPVFKWDGNIQAYDEQAGRLVFTGLHGTLLNEVYEVVNGEPVRISHFNDDLLKDRYVGVCEPLTIHSHTWDVDGYIVKPFDYDPSKKYPAILKIHGGPKGIFYPVFDQEIQQWASAGYFVFFCNPVGSDGRGNEFAEIRRLMGTVDYEDIMNFTDAVIAMYPQIDTERMGVSGISYGGYMTNWIIGHTNRFHAASSQCSVVNWVSMYGVSDISRLYVKELMGGKDPFEDPEAYWDHSPMKYAKNAVTPTLFIQPLADYRCHLSDGLQMITALMDHGCETRVVCFEGDSHGLNRLGKPSHRERSFNETMNWMNEHLKK